MPNIVTSIYTQNNICDVSIAECFFEKLDEVGLLPEKIGLYEPLRENYDIKRAIEMWTKEEPGCYEDGVGMIGKAGSMIGKLKEPSFRFDVQWWKHPSKRSINNIRFYMNPKSFVKKRKDLLSLFKDSVELFDAMYGYMTHEVPKERQHVTGTIETRMPGIFWCNYFDEKYSDFFGREKLLSYSWYRTELVGSNGVITYLAESPHKELVESDELEKEVQRYLGQESFGDIEEYLNNPTKIQFRKVPILT